MSIPKRIFSALMIASIFSSSMANIDKVSCKDWMSVDLEFSKYVISFLVPEKFSKDFPLREIDPLVNIYEDDIYNDRNYYVPFTRYWNQDESFLKGVSGTLHMSVLLYKKVDTVVGDLEELGNLEIEILTRLTNDLVGISDSRVKTMGQKYNIVLPSRTNPRQISNATWLSYRIKSHDIDDYHLAIPITKEHYLEVVFDFIDNSSGTKNNWREEAQKTVDVIISSIKISFR